MAALNGQVRVTGSSVSEQLYSAQLATGGGVFETRLNAVNPTGLAASLLVRAVGENGASLAPAVNVPLGPGEQWEREVGQLFGFDSNVLTVGSIVIESSITGILGDVAFGDPSNDRAFRASLPLDPRPSKTAAFAQVANGAGSFTGFAAFNPNGAAAAVTIATYAADGASTGSANLVLAAGGRVSKVLPEIVASSAGQVGGYFTMTSDLPISLFALFGTETLSALSAVPAQGQDLTVEFVDETEPNDGFDNPDALEIGQTARGTINPALDVDVWHFEGTAGQNIVIDVAAESLDSFLDSIVVLYLDRDLDEDGFPDEIVDFNDDFGDSLDSRLEVALPETGGYFIEIFDSFEEGGPDFSYEMSLSLAAN